MVHADASNFGVSITKEQAYAQVLEQAEALGQGNRNWVVLAVHIQCAVTSYNLANASSLLWHAFKALSSPSNAVNWAGFYVSSPSTSLSPKQILTLGPFHGRVACQTIVVGKGVCGAAAATAQTQLVPDVEKFPGHIACDGATKSEIVVPIVVDQKVVAVIDIDCEELNGFDETDRAGLERLAALLAEGCDWP